MPRRHPLGFPSVLLAVAGLAGVEARAGPPSPRRVPLIVLSSASAGQRSVEAADLAFVYYRRHVYTRRAPRSEDPRGRRIEVEDRRKECRCLRFRDWSRKKFKKMRQIEISYPARSSVARLRVTQQNGQVREFPATELYDADGALPPRLAATVDGARREYPLVLSGGEGETWPEEVPTRILLVGSAAPRRR